MSEQTQQDKAKSNGVHTPSMTVSPTNEEAVKSSNKPTSPQTNQQQVQLSAAELQVVVMQSINNVNAKKDELTIATKQLSDLATQLSKICVQQGEKIKELSKEN